MLCLIAMGMSKVYLTRFILRDLQRDKYEFDATNRKGSYQYSLGSLY